MGEKLSLGILTKESINDSNAVDSLNSFSYLAIPSLDSNSRAIIGVVNPDGTPVRKRSFSQLGYSVARDGYGTWKIIFDKEFEEPPSLIAQPMWISSVENMPKSSSQVSLAVRECTTKECIVYLGCNSFLSSYDPIKQKLFYNMVENELENKYHKDHLGITFLAIDGNFTIPSVIHGIVTDNIFFNNGTILGKGWTALKKTSSRMTDTFTWSDKQSANELHYDQAFHWIEIEFDVPFLEAPSLIVTPYFGLETKQNRAINWQNRFLNENPFTDIVVYNNSESIGHVKTVPFASVEYVSSKRALVKVGIIDSRALLQWNSRKVLRELSFSFIAVGPASNSKAVQDGKEEVSDDIICTSAPSMSPSIYGKGKGGKAKDKASAPVKSSQTIATKVTTTSAVSTTDNSINIHGGTGDKGKTPSPAPSFAPPQHAKTTALVGKSGATNIDKPTMVSIMTSFVVCLCWFMVL